jgi:branched-chain amino acid transport system ATP-binding protein
MTLLRTHNLSRSFGGLAAVDGVSIDCAVGEVHAVIGPNGAGKSTLINLLSGDLAPDAGEILFDGVPIAGLAPERISKRGVGRSYQKTNLFLPLTALANCRLAAQACRGRSMRLFARASHDAEVDGAAHRALEQVGLADRAEAIVATLSHGEQRQVEIAMVLATRPRLLLLDEPLAGMGAEESAHIVALLRRIAPGLAMLLVEHDMEAVFSLATRLTVMVNGRVLESGAPAQIRASRAVQEAYLGTGND